MLTDAWESLRMTPPCTDAVAMRRLARRLSSLAGRGRDVLGTLARLGIVDPQRLATDLELQLLLHAGRISLAKALKGNRSPAKEAAEYLAASIRWWRRHGYREPWAWRPAREPYASRIYRQGERRLGSAWAMYAWKVGESEFSRLRQKVRDMLVRDGVKPYEVDSAWETMLGQPSCPVPTFH